MKAVQLIVLIGCVSLLSSLIEVGGADEKETFCYEKPTCDQDAPGSAWNAGTCKNGKRQSPINIPITDVIEMNFSTSCPLDFGLTSITGYDLSKYRLENEGHTIKASAPKGGWPEAKFRWPAKNDGTYTLVQFHFHWGNDSNSGSEHLVDNTAFPVEMHLVHYRSGGPDSFGSFESAFASTGTGSTYALAVIGIFFKIDDKAPSVLGSFVTAMDKVSKLHALQDIDKTPVKLSGPISKQTKAYHYEGSLTTPGCNEIVQWIVLKEPLTIKTSEVKKFRDISKSQSTFRNTQMLKGRRIQYLDLIH